MHLNVKEFAAEATEVVEIAEEQTVAVEVA